MKLLFYDTSGVCNVCNQISFKQTDIDWAQRKDDLAALVDQYKGKYDYDCIVPFSGGKDPFGHYIILLKN